MTGAEHRFGSGEAFSVGVEEELFLVDPVTGRLVNASAAVLSRLREASGAVERELHACQVELITEVHATAGDAVRAIGRLRQAVAATGVGILAAGTHPSATEDQAEITDKERYERIRYLLGDAAATPVSGLHVHVGMPDAETAIRAFNGLRRDLPLLQALAANSPFRHARDTGLASSREVTLRGWPRSGAPRAMADFADFCGLVSRLTRAADVPDYTWFWWKLRPHPRLGTVEIRALDAQTRLADTAAIVALVHCLARDAAESDAGGGDPGGGDPGGGDPGGGDPGGGDPEPELLEEAIFRAARFGVHGELPDSDGRLVPVADLLDDALRRARRWADTLGCEAELAGLTDLLARGGGAGAQRATYEITGVDAVARELAELTAAEGRRPERPSAVSALPG